MKAEIEIALRMLRKSDSMIPPDKRIDQAVDVIRGEVRTCDDMMISA